LIAIQKAIEVKINVSPKPITIKIKIDLLSINEYPLRIVPSNVPNKNPNAKGIELPRYNPTNKDFLFIG
jgi:hypothetical protein